MPRKPIVMAIAAGASLAIAGVAAARPIQEPAACSGYLAAWANPNNGWIIQNFVRSLAEEQGLTVGDLTSANAHQHGGSLEACIPD
jgi:hypothetical protein